MLVDAGCEGDAVLSKMNAAAIKTQVDGPVLATAGSQGEVASPSTCTPDSTLHGSEALAPTSDLVMVANRGEIACRVLRTCARLGLRTLAVFTSTDALAPHVRAASTAVALGPNPREYTNQARLLAIAREYGVTALHPGYGFLSENEEFCAAVTQAGIAWLGPRAQTMHDFALKHVARELAANAGVPVLLGSGLLTSAEEAVAAATKVGYPVLLKATGGGGGMGIYTCRSDEDVLRQFEASQHQGKAFFGNDGVFCEKLVEEAHHVEVQIFGDGQGGCIALGERECSIQRRHQKVLEESPSPLVDPELRSALTSAATALGAASRYRSAGTVEFLVDGRSRAFFFLEVNGRLQVEHGITEMVHGNIDIVEAQLRLQVPSLTPPEGPAAVLTALAAAPRSGHAIEVRINGEDAAKGFQPCPGTLGCVAWPQAEEGVRVDTWVETGTEVSPHYDSLLGKLMVWAPSREEAVVKMQRVLGSTRLQGTPNNTEFLRALVADPRFMAGDTTTRFLDTFTFTPSLMEVITPGMQASVQDWPGRTRRWAVGVPPSGPMDAAAHRLANALVGNEEEAAALEFSLQGPSLRFCTPRLVALTGAVFSVTLDGVTLDSPCWRSFMVEAGQVLAIGAVEPASGVRGYLAVQGGIDVPHYLGSRATFPSAKFGGYQGRYLRAGDSLALSALGAQHCAHLPLALPPELQPSRDCTPQADGSALWEVGALPGPHADPDYITSAFMDQVFYREPYSVHYNSNRLGVRLVGPKPDWVRADGGEGGTHPSNVHDHVYALGAINFTGDHPVVLTVDGPSLGGFVCPATITSTEVWKVGQVRPGDRVLFRRLTLPEAHAALLVSDATVAAVCAVARSNEPQGLVKAVQEAQAAARGVAAGAAAAMPETRPLLAKVEASVSHPGAEYRLAGDRYMQVDFGPMELDLALRVRVDLLQQALAAAQVDGLVECSPGVRSLMVEYDMRRLAPAALLDLLQATDAGLPDPSSLVLPSRILHLPMAYNDSTTCAAIDKYMKSIRPEAPYLPSNIDYIAANNGLAGGADEVQRTLFSASYLVLGLGDVYLGAPCAVPLDPRHRLVTSKYNPARTFTEEGTVGIGGCYMCIYPMDSPGGYQLVGRTLPIWNTFGRAGPFTPDRPWLLRYFDQVRFFEVSEAELLTAREAFAAGRWELRVEDSVFDMAAYRADCQRLQPEVAALNAQQREAQEQQLQLEAASLARLEAARGQGAALAAPEGGEEDDSAWQRPGCVCVMAPFTANVWDVKVKVGSSVAAGEVCVVLEAMKMETPVVAPCAGVVCAVRAVTSQLSSAGSLLLVIRTQEEGTEAAAAE